MVSSKRTVLITGCSDGGLGRFLALAFQEAGWRVIASARTVSKTKAVAEAGIEVVQLDTLSAESISAAVIEVSNLTGGSLDMVLNNAGGGYTAPVLDIQWEQARDLFELNFYSLISVTRAFLPLLRASKSGGIVVNNTSGASLWVGAMPFAGAYNASKGAATQLTETMRLELAPFGIRVINLLTGGVRTTFYDNAKNPSLPADSIFNVAKDRVERAMGGKEIMEKNLEPMGYARKVVAKLSVSNPSHWVWAGKNSTLAWLATFLPIGAGDSMIKKMTGLDVVETTLKEAKKTS
ncbi:IBR finger domain protein [Pseudovirgaria hyperparasitica]|uniref:IBR finger domain protein n=1 Tax=Pseudovirgaria hyperparasitica TaxID=470096 RepID=A0A6A6W112_9PEZI|nr:IBR finger domain protein [Pseudovirgaria hyperparasitica]KAF2756592.1 IBR finger domain protein [Pseudovirgaria hyperparasitica]